MATSSEKRKKATGRRKKRAKDRSSEVQETQASSTDVSEAILSPGGFFKELRGEFSRITWPSTPEIVMGTLVSIFILIGATALLGICSMLFNYFYS